MIVINDKFGHSVYIQCSFCVITRIKRRFKRTYTIHVVLRFQTALSGWKSSKYNKYDIENSYTQTVKIGWNFYA